MDDEWVDAGNRRVAYFPHLPSGHYVFRVTAANADGVWNNDGVAVRITVFPPFWKTWWFALLVAVSFAFVVRTVSLRRAPPPGARLGGPPPRPRRPGRT